MAISILNQAVQNKNTLSITYTATGFNVPAGTSRLLVQIEYRAASDTVAPAVSSVFHNATDPVSVMYQDATPGYQNINVWWGQRESPDIGTFDVSIAFASEARGCKIWLLALNGEQAGGSILGNVNSQLSSPTVTNTAGLGLTPSAAGSMLLGSLAFARPTTLTSWTGTGFVEVATGQYTYLDYMTATSRYRLNAPLSANTISAVFGDSDTDIGGHLIEILAEATSVDVSGNIAFGLSITGTAGVEGVSSARFADASYRSGKSSWTEIWMLQPDLAGVDRRICTIGPAAAPTYLLDMVHTGTVASDVYRWRYRLADGVVSIETGPGTQTAAAHVIVLVHQPGNPVAYVNGIESVSSRSGFARIGVLDLGSGGMALGGHDEASPAAYTGVIGRYLLYDGVMSAQQVKLLATSLLDPDVMWGYGSENDAQVTNRSPVAMPLLVQPDGRPSMTITPRKVDPDGTVPTITFVTQGAHTTVAISGGNQLVLNFDRGWQGQDALTYTLSDASKSSIGKITIDQRRPALLARDDAITVAGASSILFDPRLNDVGAGILRVISVTPPSAGTAVIQADGRIRYTPGA